MDSNLIYTELHCSHKTALKELPKASTKAFIIMQLFGGIKKDETMWG